MTRQPGTLPRVEPLLIQGIPARLLMRRPDIRAAAWQVAAQSAQIGIAEADFYPAISLLGSIGWSGNSLSDSPDVGTLAVGPGLNWNVFDYGRIENNVRVQDARLQQLIEQYQDTVLQAARETDDAAISVVKSAEQQQLLAASVRAARRSLELANTRYREGYAGFQRVLDAQQALFSQTQSTGTWIFDGDPNMSVTPRQAIESLVGDEIDISYVRAMETSRSRSTASFDKAVSAASRSDAVILFLGEESILSGEAHSRADICLPGAQASLVRSIRGCGKPVIAVIMAGRPLTLTEIVDDVDAILFAWHPGTMGGEAIAELIFGIRSPSGKLPASFPRMVGQVPIYYGQKNTGKPPCPESIIHIDQIPVGTPQTSLGMSSFHLDAGYKPLYPFGFGLSYTEFEYDNLKLSAEEIPIGGSLTVSVDVTNAGEMPADEVVQLYVRDLVANVTRPVKELKGFRRIPIEPGQTVSTEFELHTDDLAFFGRDNTLIVEPGDFHLWVGGASDSGLRAGFALVAKDSPDGAA